MRRNAMKIKDFIQICKEDGALAGWLCLLTSIILLVSSFVLPPTGLIDTSVLAAVGELLLWGVIFKLPQMINSVKDGKAFKIKHNETEIEVSSTKNEE